MLMAVLFFLPVCFSFLSLVSPQSDKLSYAAAALQAGGNSQSPGQASTSISASPQVLNIPPSCSALKGTHQTPVHQ